MGGGVRGRATADVVAGAGTGQVDSARGGWVIAAVALAVLVVWVLVVVQAMAR